MTDNAGMDDQSGFGSYQDPLPPRQTPSESPVPAPASRGFAISPTVVVVAIVVLTLAIGAFGFLKLADEGGKAAVEANDAAVGAIQGARSVEAETTLHAVANLAQGYAAENGSMEGITPDVLRSIEPSFTYTSGPSTGPRTVSVAVSGSAFAAAVKAGDACRWIKIDPTTGVVKYGHGSPCTGTAAMGASAASF